MSQWPGAKSQRFAPTRKILSIGYSAMETEFHSPASGLLALREKAGKTEGEKEKRHFEERYGKVSLERRLCFHKTASLVTLSHGKGLKHLSPAFTAAPKRAERLHLQQDLPQPGPWRFHMHMVRNEAGHRPQDQPSPDFDFHATMLGRKSRVEDPRNGLPVSSLGDKVYGAVEYAPGYFQQEGLAPGLAYRRRIKAADKGAAGVFETVQSYAGTSPVRLTWRERLARQEEAGMQKDMEDLLVWERTTLKEVYPGLPDPDETDEEPI